MCIIDVLALDTVSIQGTACRSCQHGLQVVCHFLHSSSSSGWGQQDELAPVPQQPLPDPSLPISLQYNRWVSPQGCEQGLMHAPVMATMNEANEANMSNSVANARSSLGEHQSRPSLIFVAR